MKKMRRKWQTEQTVQDPEQMKRQMEKDMEVLRNSEIFCDCYGCRRYGNGEIRIRHPWFFGKYRERKARERYENSVTSREKTLVELKKILAEYEERLQNEENDKWED